MVLRFEGEHVGDRRYRVSTDGSIFATRLLPHTRLKVSNSPGKMLAITQPAGGLEDFFVELAAFSKGTGGPWH